MTRGFAPPNGPGQPPWGPGNGDFRPRFERPPTYRWVAHPPPGGPITAPRVARPERPYQGPPSYRRTGFPRWGFPPVVWRAEPAPEPAPRPVDPGPGLRRIAWLAAGTAAAALFAAGAEIWRFVLMLQGRTLVLDGSVVRTSDVLVAAAGILAPLTALVTLICAVPVLARTNAAAAFRMGRAPSRSLGAVAARVLVPGWNIYGAGQVVAEIDRLLSAGRRRPDDLASFESAANIDGAASIDDGAVGPGGGAPGAPRASRITICWWLGWVLSAVLLIATLARGVGGSLQAIADTVELHIAVDLAAALVAALGVLMLRRFRLLLAAPKNDFEAWIVQPPAPTRPLPVEAAVAG